MLKHPEIKDRFLLIRTIKEREIPDTFPEIEIAMELFSDECMLRRYPIWIFDIVTGECLVSASRIGEILTPKQVNDQSKPRIT